MYQPQALLESLKEVKQAVQKVGCSRGRPQAAEFEQ